MFAESLNVDDAYPPLGSLLIEFSLSLSNVASSIFRRKYDDNINIRNSPAILVLIQGIQFVMKPFRTESIRYVSYDDQSEGVEFGMMSHI